jgi:hypothetical protein
MTRTKLVSVLGAVLVAVGVALSVPTTAAADTVGPTILADLNGDGILDQVVFSQIGSVTSTACAVTVSNGLASGGFGPPTMHTYKSAEPVAPFCPDLAVAMKMGNQTLPDLITAFGFGGTDLVDLHSFQPVATFHGLNQPNWLRTGDLNGDGRPDLIEASMQSEFLGTRLNTPQGTLVPGPISACVAVNSGLPQYVLADFNGDRRNDMLLSANCPGQIKAEVLFTNGQAPAVLASTTDFQARWTVFSIDLNYAGVVEVSGTGVTTVQYFQNDGAGHFTLVP